jgi:hypothetical protein
MSKYAEWRSDIMEVSVELRGKWFVKDIPFETYRRGYLDFAVLPPLNLKLTEIEDVPPEVPFDRIRVYRGDLSTVYREKTGGKDES